MFAPSLPSPAPPLAAGDLPSDVGLRYELVPCTVDPRQVRLIVYDRIVSGVALQFTRRQISRLAAQRYLAHYIEDPAFRTSERKAAMADMEMY